MRGLAITSRPTRKWLTLAQTAFAVLADWFIRGSGSGKVDRYSGGIPRSRVRLMIEPAVGVKRKSRMIVPNISVLLRSGATGVDCSVGAGSGCRKTGFTSYTSHKPSDQGHMQLSTAREGFPVNPCLALRNKPSELPPVCQTKRHPLLYK